MGLTILEGSTFCICDEIGDLDGKTSGLFAEDTRFLSRLELRIDGVRPLLLSSGKVEYFSAAFYLRNPVVPGLPQDTLSIARERFVGEGMQDHLILRNESAEPLSFELELEVGTDFADIITVKEHDFALGHPETARPLPPPAAARFDADANQLVLEEATNGGAQDAGALLAAGHDRRPARRASRSSSRRASAGSCASTSSRRSPEAEAHRGSGRAPLRRGARSNVRESLETWRLRVPRLRVAVRRLCALRSRSRSPTSPRCGCAPASGLGMLPAAGMPWFMTVFGRDTLITSLQTMLLGPELAIASLEALAALQAREDDASIDAEPGKILHELRRGRAAETWFGTYYGTVDATPLFLVLLSEAWRWTADAELVQRLREPALAALGWIDVYGDRDEDGFVEYERRTPRGLENQSWKDSGDSQRFHDGSFARTPIAPAEVQGYVYDAKLRLAELARAVWDDEPLAERLEAEADGAAGPLRRAATGSRSAAATTRSRWTATSGPSTRSAPTSGICSGAGSSRPSGWRRSRTGCSATSSGRAGGSGRCRPPMPRTTRSATTTAPSGRTTRRWARGARPGRAHGRRVDDRRRAARGGALLRLVAARGVRRLHARRDAVPDRLSDRGAATGVGRRHAGPAAAAAARPRARPGDARAPHHRRGRSRVARGPRAARACARSGAPGTSRSRTGG